jgi:hypothetical protein
MQKSTINILRLSAVVAVGLWLLATLGEMLLRPPPPPAPALFGEPAAPAQPSAPAVPASCPAVEDNLENLVGESRACETDDDCTMFDYGYPIDCMTSVAKSAIPGLRTAYKQYDESCEHRLFYDCPTDPFVRVPVCRNQRCTVELFGNGSGVEGRSLERN